MDEPKPPTPLHEQPLFDPNRTPVLARKKTDRSAVWHVYYVAARGKWFICDCGKEIEVNPDEWERA